MLVRLVLRRILRRAVRFCHEVLQTPSGTLASLVPTVCHILVKYISHNPPEQHKESVTHVCIFCCQGNVYPELHKEADTVRNTHTMLNQPGYHGDSCDHMTCNAMPTH